LSAFGGSVSMLIVVAVVVAVVVVVAVLTCPSPDNDADEEKVTRSVRILARTVYIVVLLTACPRRPEGEDLVAYDTAENNPLVVGARQSTDDG